MAPLWAPTAGRARHIPAFPIWEGRSRIGRNDIFPAYLTALLAAFALLLIYVLSEQDKRQNKARHTMAHVQRPQGSFEPELWIQYKALRARSLQVANNAQKKDTRFITEAHHLFLAI
ncbi:hypothetical protein A0H81_02257 [Grifola frondosa]|uniref:Uncharacterized protein n=1 Tax=Grifola frondosa TaxID=5627 RepID=A0A1C7MLE7_GRIFR|nr:hypothetical protein A0H81_02257 [Grifola frondosa]